jgi:hypothetical protein
MFYGCKQCFPAFSIVSGRKTMKKAGEH